MRFRQLGKTGISISTIAFGAGPVSGLLTSTDRARQRAVLSRAISLGVNWIDTAATYGNGQSEASLGEALAELDSERAIHLATKVRVQLTTQTDLRPLVVDSVKASLSRLRRPKVTLLQLHNSITVRRNDQPTSVTPEDLLGPRGILEGMEEVRAAGWVEQLGLTGIGDSQALQIVLESDRFATIQAPLHLLNPSALRDTPAALCDPDYGGFLRRAHQLGMGIFAIRVYAAGALLGAEPSAHTLKTPFFPLDLYQRDQARAAALAARLTALATPAYSPEHHSPAGYASLTTAALRYVLSLPAITSAIIGFGAVEHVEEAARIAALEPLSPEQIVALESLRNETAAGR